MKNNGWSLMEMLLVIVIISIMGLMSHSKSLKQVERNDAKKSIDTSTKIANAGIYYYKDNGSWPSNIDALIPKYIKDTQKKNDFGYSYNLYTNKKYIRICSNIPKGLLSNNRGTTFSVTGVSATMDTACISKVISYGTSERLAYAP